MSCARVRRRKALESPDGARAVLGVVLRLPPFFAEEDEEAGIVGVQAQNTARTNLLPVHGE